MNKFLFFFIALLMISVTVPFALATPIETSFLHDYRLENNGVDVNNSLNLSNVGSPAYTTVAQEGITALANTVSTALENTGANGLTGGNSAMSISFWAKHDSITTADYFGGLGAYTTTGTMFFMSNTDATTVNMLGIANDLTFTTSTRISNTYYYYSYVYLGNKSVLLYLDGVLQQSQALANNQNLNTNKITIGQSHGGGARFAGDIDDFRIYDYALSSTQINNIYNNPNGTTVSDPYIYINLQDLYDNANLEGLTVTLSDGTSNTTQSDGIAYFYNKTTQSFNVTDSNNLYFDYESTSNPTENSTTTYNVSGAFVNLYSYDLLNTSLSSFNVSSGNSVNTTSTTTLKLYLKPNATNTLTINATDYLQLLFNVSTTGQDTGTYNITGLYQTFLTVNVNTFLGSALQNHTTNVSNSNISLSATTTNYNTTYNLMFGDYVINSLPENYSLTNTSITIVSGNLTPVVTLIAYTLNTFFLYFLDEITEQPILQNMTVELINSLVAVTTTSVTGNVTTEVLTPDDYTLRYLSTIDANYTERDYYQTLTNLNYHNLTLYSLGSSDSTDMLVSVKNTGGDPVEGAIVKLLRYYSSCNCYNVVEMSKTSANGEGYFIVDAYDGHYKFSVDYLGTNYFLSTSPTNFIPNNGLVTRTITINLGQAYFESFRELTNIGRTLVHNNLTNALTFSWSDPSGIVTRGCIYASYIDGVHYTDLTPVCLNASTGSVVMDLNNTNLTYKYYAEIETSTQYSDYVLFAGNIEKVITSLFTDVKFGGFVGAIFTIFMALLFSFSAIAVLISVSLSIILLSFMGAFTFSLAFITGFVALILGISLYGMRS